MRSKNNKDKNIFEETKMAYSEIDVQILEV